MKHALVTGVGRQMGIAAAVTRHLQDAGWFVSTAGLRAYDRRMPWGADHEPLAEFDVDFALADAPAELFTQIANQPDRGPVTALVMCHCESVDSGILDTTVEAWDRHFAVNSRSIWLLIREFANQFPPRVADSEAHGRIVAFTSDAVVDNMPYGASKGALDRIITAASVELAPLGITANAINPGANDTGWMSDDVKRFVLNRNAQTRIGTPTDAANLVTFLLSEQASWINGQLLYSDGGLRQT